MSSWLRAGRTLGHYFILHNLLNIDMLMPESIRKGSGMFGQTHKRILILLLFSLYALSPVAVCAGHFEHAVAWDAEPFSRHSSSAILSIKVTLAALTDIDPDDINDDGHPECKIVLMKKESGVLRCPSLSVPGAAVLIRSTVHDIVCYVVSRTVFSSNNHHRDMRGFSQCSSGLAPPLGCS